MNLDIVRIPFILFCLLVITKCNPLPKSDLSEVAFIPIPVKVIAGGGFFHFSSNTQIFIDNDLLQPHLAVLNQSIIQNYDFELEEVSQRATSQMVILELDTADHEIPKEGYELEVSENQINVKASSPSGIFYGVQTLDQIIVESSEVNKKIPTGKITDYPKYEYRGMMLDVARRFFTIAEVKKLIDQISVLKANVLHLHLSDDQGWRIEIKARPKLTEIGSKSEVGTGKGGFYTQEEYQDLVAYAASKYVTIIPEIDMPGHTNAALVSYAALNCEGVAPSLYRGTEVGFSTLCTDSEETYLFVEDVIRELAALTPGNYIHIGGDESMVTAKEDYIYFVNRVQSIVNKYDKRMIGWDEVATAKLDQSSVVQQWHSKENARLAAENGNQVILSPATHTYLDMKYDSSTRVGQDWAGLIPVKFGYDWLPDTLNDGITKDLILGIEAPLWTEFVMDYGELEYLAFPRFVGYAELAWSPVSHLSWSGYRKRLRNYANRWEREEVNYYRDSTVFFASP